MAYVAPSEPAAFARLERSRLAPAAETAEPDRARLSAAATFEVVSTRPGFDALEPEWNDLFRRAGGGAQVFQTFNWNWHWANHYLAATSERSGPQLAIVAVRCKGRLVMLWPLVTTRVWGIKVLHWMGEPASQYGDVLAEDLPEEPDLMRQAWHFVTTQLGADAISLRKVRADAVVAPLLREQGLSQTATALAPYLDLASAPDYARYEQRYTSKARKNRRRLLRRLSEQGPFAIEWHTGGTHARDAARQAIEMKRKWVMETGRISRALTDERFAAFFADVAEGRARPSGCGVSVLRSNGEPAGIAIDVTCGDRRAAHIIVHDPRFDSFSAGTLLLEAWIKQASADRMATFDLLAPAFAYKLDWSDGTVAVEDFAQGVSLAGRAYVTVYLGWVRQAAKAVAEALPHAISTTRALGKRLGLARRKPAASEPPVSASS